MYKISITPEEIEKMDPGAFPGEIVVIDRQGLAFFRALEYLRRQKVLGFDTESRPNFSPQHHHYGVALLQLSGPDRAYLFRVKSLTMYKRLFKVLADERVVKVGAAVGDDIHGLQRYCDFKPKSFVDLQKKMAAIILGVRISKTQQLSNWEAEHLSEAQKKYAATDAWVCREMYLKLLDSEKHPLTPEQMAPNPPHVEEKKHE